MKKKIFPLLITLCLLLLGGCDLLQDDGEPGGSKGGDGNGENIVQQD